MTKIHSSWKIIWLIILSSACNNVFAPAPADNNLPGNLLLTEQRTPEEVLVNFQYAYTFKDSLVYSELFDSSFIFLGTNFNVSPPEAIVWGRDQELSTVGQIFRFFNTLDLSFDNIIRKDTLSLDTLNFQPLEIKHTINFSLTLDGGSSIPTLIGRVFFFYRRRDDKWFIYRWEDLQI